MIRNHPRHSGQVLMPERRALLKNDSMSAWEHTLTVDASVDAVEQVIGIGIVIQERSGRRNRGPIVARISERHWGIAVGKAEEFAVLRALEIVIARGFSRVKIRSDYNQMRRALREQYRRGRVSETDELRRRILALADRLELVHFAWVPRRRNQVAHALARTAMRDMAAGESAIEASQTAPVNATAHGAGNVEIAPMSR